MRTSLALLLVAAGCGGLDGGFVCATDGQCVDGRRAGRCEPTLRCSFPDLACASGFRYGDYAGALSSSCVGAPDFGVSDGAAPICFDSLVGGGNHACGVAGGRVFCWGQNTLGQLGNGGLSIMGSDQLAPDPTSPVVKDGPPHDPLSDVATIAAGPSFSCALTHAGGVWCWGYNGSGDLGDGTTTTTAFATPIRVSGVRFEQLAVGRDHGCAIEEGTGHVWCWGLNSSSQLDLPDGGQVVVTPAPMQMPVPPARAIAAGASHTCALSLVGAGPAEATWCWGLNSSGQLGISGASGSWPPLLINPDAGVSGAVAEITAGDVHTCARIGGGAGAGQVWCWGGNSSGQIGVGDLSSRGRPTLVDGLPGPAERVVAHGGHTCAIVSVGGAHKIACWGSNAFGEIGDGSNADALRPVTLDLDGVRDLALGTSHTCALTSDGVAWCWGYGGHGQFGNGLQRNALAPVAALPLCMK